MGGLGHHTLALDITFLDGVLMGFDGFDDDVA